MPMTSASVPSVEPTIPEPVEHVAEAPKPESKAAKALGRASESGDAGVQFLLAQRHVHESNGDSDGVDVVNARLAELGLV